MNNDNKRPKSSMAQIGIFISLVVIASLSLINTVVDLLENLYSKKILIEH